MSSPNKTSKWDSLLQGIDGSKDRAIANLLLANQSKYFEQLDAETAKLNVGAFTKFAFPMIRKVSPQLVANDVVSVQPMSGPIGGIAFYKPRYGSKTGAIMPGMPTDEDGKPIYSLNVSVRSTTPRLVGEEMRVVVGIIRNFQENQHGQWFCIVEDGQTGQLFEFFFYEIERASLLEVVAAAATE